MPGYGGRGAVASATLVRDFRMKTRLPGLQLSTCLIFLIPTWITELTASDGATMATCSWRNDQFDELFDLQWKTCRFILEYKESKCYPQKLSCLDNRDQLNGEDDNDIRTHVRDQDDSKSQGNVVSCIHSKTQDALDMSVKSHGENISLPTRSPSSSGRVKSACRAEGANKSTVIIPDTALNATNNKSDDIGGDVESSTDKNCPSINGSSTKIWNSISMSGYHEANFNDESAQSDFQGYSSNEYTASNSTPLNNAESTRIQKSDRVINDTNYDEDGFDEDEEPWTTYIPWPDGRTYPNTTDGLPDALRKIMGQSQRRHCQGRR